MIRWCSYCQQFKGEVPPYDQLSTTHGVCAACAATVDTITDLDLDRIHALKTIQGKLARAGRAGDLEAARHLIDEAFKSHGRAVDVLMGLIAPALYQVGEDWKCGAITVAQEHRFTQLCQDAFNLVAAETAATLPPNFLNGDRADVVLVNARGNRHTLAIGFLSLWMISRGLRPRTLTPSSTPVDLIPAVRALRPRLFLISIALPEHRSAAVSIVEALSALPDSLRPRIIIGGHAVKTGVVEPVPGADLMADINMLDADPMLDATGVTG